jgi:ribonuclease/clavin/mitogillin
MQVPDVERWSERVVVVRGLNPGPFTGPGTNTYLVGRGARPLLIDTGGGVAGYLDLLGRALREEFAAAEPGDVLLTHAHPDHVGGVAGILERFGPRGVYKRPLPEWDAHFGLQPLPLGEGSVIETEGARLRALHCPGHAADHLCFWLEEERALFSGDVVLGAGTTLIPVAGGSMRLYLESLRRIQGLDVARIYPGHGPRVDDPGPRVQAYLAHRETREAQIVAALRERPSSAEALVTRMYPQLSAELHKAAAQSVLSHLLKLEEERRAARSEPDAIWALC